MSASKFLLFGTSYFRSFRSHKSPSLAPSLIFTKHFPSVSLSFHRYYSSAATDAIAEIDTEGPSSSTYHPWPEWITFVDRLKAKGYFVELPAKNESEGTTDAGTAGPETLYKDISLLKDACLSFARDRYDVFKYVCYCILFSEMLLNWRETVGKKGDKVEYYVHFLLSWAKKCLRFCFY